MARRAKSEVNKSQAIRDYYNSNPKAKPKEVVEALAAQGITVAAGFVSTLRSNDKRKGGKAGKRGPGRPAGSTKGENLGLEALVQAKKLADKMGGIAQARRALDALARILAE